jgi:N-acetylglucosamine-6-phosphate deacetylase
MNIPVSSHYVIKTDRLFTPDELRGTFWVEIDAGRINHILTEQPSGIEVLDATGFLVAPGFIDVHIHGYDKHDIMEASSEALECMATGLPHDGVTSFLPTTMGSPSATLQRIMATLSPKLATVEGARPLGWHLEGPFLNMPGAMNPEGFEIPTITGAKALVDSGPVMLMAVAPEREGAIPVIEYLVSRGVHVSIGHTDADFEHAAAGIAAGASSVTHLFSVMRPFHHREPGPVGAAFLYDVYLQFIADGVHTHPATVALVCRYLKDRLVLVSDHSVLSTGLGVEGKFMRTDEGKVTVDGGAVRFASGRLGGSVLTLDLAVRNVVNIGGLDLASAFRAAGQNPARSIGVTDRGIIRPGAVADIVILTPDLHVSSTICEGSVVYGA